MAQPGRDDAGRFGRDDATIKQLITALIVALKLTHEWMLNPAMDARMRQAHARVMADEIATAERALAEVDVGERPARQPDIERRTRFETTRKDQ